MTASVGFFTWIRYEVVALFDRGFALWPSVWKNEWVNSDLTYCPAPAGTTTSSECTFRVLRLRNRFALELSDIAPWNRLRRNLHSATLTEMQSRACPWDRHLFQLHASIR